MMHSAAYSGRISHVRRGAPSNAFCYRIFMLYLDLDELDALQLAPLLSIERPGLLSFRRRDYRGSRDASLKETILSEVADQIGHRPSGAVRMLTHVRSLGPAFNPVTFYYCFEKDESLCAVLAEITNTPWGERHSYVLAATNGEVSGRFKKAFHVSPFWPMSHTYEWRISAPAGRLGVHMRNLVDDTEVFHASLRLNRHELTRKRLLGFAAALPLMSLRVLLLIYCQALRLWLKGARVFDHPAKAIAPTPTHPA